MEASKFDPHVNWLPPAYCLNTEFHALNPANPDQLELRILEDCNEDQERIENLEFTEGCCDHDTSSSSNLVIKSTKVFLKYILIIH